VKPKVYLETTIPSLLTAWPSRDLIIAADQQLTKEWWRNRRRDFELFVPQVVLDEAAEGDRAAASARLAEIRGLPILEVNGEVEHVGQDRAQQRTDSSQGIERCIASGGRGGASDAFPAHMELSALGQRSQVAANSPQPAGEPDLKCRSFARQKSLC
jgi:hypothetical protein